MVLLTLPGRNRKEGREPDTLQTLTPTLSHLCLSVRLSVWLIGSFPKGQKQQGLEPWPISISSRSLLISMQSEGLGNF